MVSVSEHSSAPQLGRTSGRCGSLLGDRFPRSLSTMTLAQVFQSIRQDHDFVIFHAALRKVTVRCCISHSVPEATPIYFSHQGMLYTIGASDVLFSERGVKSDQK